MADEPEVTPPPSEGLTEDELKGIVGSVVDEKLEPLKTQLDGISMPDLKTFKSGILDDIGKLFGENKTTVDEDGMLEKVGKMLDEKMKGVSNSPAVKRVGGPLSRWLAG